MTINAPSLLCTITPPHKVGVNYASYIAYDGGSTSMSITENFGRQGTTATIPIIDANYSTGVPPKLVVNPSFTFPAFSTVQLVDANAASYYGSTEAGTLFAGYISGPSLQIMSPTEAEWLLSCVDYTGYANASITQYTFDGISMGDAVVDLVKKANCGIKAATIANGGYVQPGPVIPRTVIHYTNLTTALQKISNMASGQSAYGWYVDSNLNLHFYDQQQASDSGVTVTDSPTQSGLLSFTECHIVMDGSFKYEFDGSSIYNRALVVGQTRTVSANIKKKATDTFTGNGTKASWLLSRVPSSEAGIKLTVNGIAQTVSVYDGSTKSTSAWVVSQNDNGTWSLHVNPGYTKVPSAGSVIKIWYGYKTTITALADLKQSQNTIGGPNSGVFAKVVSQTTIQSTAAAHQRAVRELAEYGHAQERISFSTSPEWVGVWRAGQTFTLDSKLLLDSQRGFAPGLTATFMILQQTITFGQGGFRTCQVEAVRV